MRSGAIDGKADVLTSRLTSITVVVLDDCGTLDMGLLDSFVKNVSSYCVDSETIIVANGVDQKDLLALKRLVAELPDCSCYVIADAVDTDAARIFGMEAAVGDYVLLVNGNALAAITVALPATIRALQDGFDLAVALPREAMRPGSAVSMLEWMVYGMLSKLSGLSISRTPCDLFALSRDAILYILSKPNAELLLKARTAGRGFPAHTIPDAYSRSPVPFRQRRFAQRAAGAMGLLVSIGAVPLRVVSIVSIASSILSIVYAVYVVTVYFLKQDVAPGWTTLSLQVSGMMFLFSVMLALLSEYIVQIYAATRVRRRRQVVRELRSEKTVSSDRLNVVDESGLYQLGGPAYPSSTGGLIARRSRER
jgi:polyisoprenyl-phosphate glycosyltransferase